MLKIQKNEGWGGGEDEVFPREGGGKLLPGEQ